MNTLHTLNICNIPCPLHLSKAWNRKNVADAEGTFCRSCLSCEHEFLSLDPWQQYQKQTIAVCVCNPCSGDRQKARWSYCLQSPAIVSSGFTEETLSHKQGKVTVADIPKPTSALHMIQMQMHLHTHEHILTLHIHRIF